MAIYRLEAKSISRGQGRSCVAAAAYRHATVIRDERRDVTYSYARKQGVVHSEIIAPDGAPDWARQRAWLWNHLDKAEKRRDAITAREVLLSLPRELSQDQQVELVRAFVREQFTARGIIADIAIHAPEALDGISQPHAHIMLADRVLDLDAPNGLAGKKDATLSRPDGIQDLRLAWELHANAALEHAGLDLRIDRRSLAARSDEARMRGHDPAISDQDRENAIIVAAVLDRDPEPKIGPVAMAMHRQGRGDQSYALKRVLVVRDERSVIEQAATALRQKVADIAAPLVDLWNAWSPLGGESDVKARELRARQEAEKREKERQNHLKAERERYAMRFLGLNMDQRARTVREWFRDRAEKFQLPELLDQGKRHAYEFLVQQAFAAGYRQAETPGQVESEPVIVTARRLDRMDQIVSFMKEAARKYLAKEDARPGSGMILEREADLLRRHSRDPVVLPIMDEPDFRTRVRKAIEVADDAERATRPTPKPKPAQTKEPDRDYEPEF